MTYKEKWQQEIKDNKRISIIVWLVAAVIMVFEIKALFILMYLCVLVFMGMAFQPLSIACPQCRMTLVFANMKHAPFSSHNIPVQCLECGFDFLQKAPDDVVK
ncbi:hypothetical protein [Marinicella meishanensis]|uniref:hypothetical protein n=1 Tax=Marinicella meishanensis TaxID=2873263 RepID=UPI001CBADFE4|nr:hypothetical protein [Marinicella sp. NBU2979]